MKQAIKSENPRITPKGINKELKKRTREIIGILQKSEKQMKVATQQAIETTMDQIKDRIKTATK